MDVGRVAFHLLQVELNLCLRDDLLLIYANNARFLSKFARAAAPTRPDAEPDVIDWQSRRRNYTQHANECLHSIDFAAYVLAKNSALQIRKNNVGPHRYLIYMIPRISSVNNPIPSTIR